MDNSRRRRVKAVKDPLERLLQFGIHCFEEACEVGGAANLGGNDLRNGREADVGRRRRVELGGEKAEPFFGDDKGDEEVRLGRKDEGAKVEHWVYVASPWIRHRHQVAMVVAADGGGASGFFLHLFAPTQTQLSNLRPVWLNISEMK